MRDLVSPNAGNPINYRKFGSTGLHVSEIGLGCSDLAGGVFVDNREAVQALLQAFDSGINFFDTSVSYGQGESERIIGRALKGRRDRVIIATKGGYDYTPVGKVALRLKKHLWPLRCVLRPVKGTLVQMRASQKRPNFSINHLKGAVNGSLRRLQTDYLDLFQLHNPPTSLFEVEDHYELLESLKAQGKIRYYGVACPTVEDALVWCRYPGVSSIQVPISLVNQEALTELLPQAVQEKLAVIAREPLAQGLLTDELEYTKAEIEAKTRTEFQLRRDRANAFRFLANQERTIAQAALRFVVQLQGVSVVIAGISSLKHLEQNLGALVAPPLTDDELSRVQSTFMGLCQRPP